MRGRRTGKLDEQNVWSNRGDLSKNQKMFDSSPVIRKNGRWIGNRGTGKFWWGVALGRNESDGAIAVSRT